MNLQLFAKATKLDTNITGVSSSVQNAMNQQYEKSNAVKQGEINAQTALDKVNNYANQYEDGIISGSTWKKVNSSYQMSDSVQNAMNYTDKLLKQLSTGKTSYSDQVNEMIQQIMDRDKFSYDPDTDTLFQQALSSAMNSGKSAMQDTMGQAAALTGGYGSTYATSAGNQAYNSFVEGAYDNLPQYYQMALQTYQMDTEDMYNKLNMLNTADDKEYSRLDNAYGRNFQNWTQKYNMEYQQWADSVNFALQSAGLQLNETSTIGSLLNNAYSANQSWSDSVYSRDYGQYQDNRNYATQVAQMQNSDYWKKYSASQSASSSASAKQKELLNAAQSAYAQGQSSTGKGTDAVKKMLDYYGITDETTRKQLLSYAKNTYDGRTQLDSNLLNDAISYVSAGEHENYTDYMEGIGYGLEESEKYWNEATNRVNNANATSGGQNYNDFLTEAGNIVTNAKSNSGLKGKKLTADLTGRVVDYVDNNDAIPEDQKDAVKDKLIRDLGL